MMRNKKIWAQILFVFNELWMLRVVCNKKSLFCTSNVRLTNNKIIRLDLKLSTRVKSFKEHYTNQLKQTG